MAEKESEMEEAKQQVLRAMELRNKLPKGDPKIGKRNFTPVNWKGNSYVNPNGNIGRNDPCACGSGRKFKNCCINKNQK